MRLAALIAFAVFLTIHAPVMGQTFDDPSVAYETALDAHRVGNYKVAIDLFRPLAERGFPSSQFALGYMYDEGQGVRQSDSKAVKWYGRAAEAGHTSAQYNLGLMYEGGKGVPQDYSEAIKWYRRASEKGASVAQSKLGSMYEVGKGVAQNHSKAAKWYRKSARQGNTEALTSLGYMYATGDNFRESPSVGYILLSLAVARGQESAIKGRDLVIQLLTRQQIARAQQLASEWEVGKPLPSPRDIDIR